MCRIAAVTLLLIQTAVAHHGQDFFVNLDARVPQLGSISTFATASYGKDAFGGEESSIEPGFLVGTGFGTSVGLTAEWSNSDDSPFNHAGITPLLQWSAAIPDSPFRIGVAASYYIANSAAASTLGGHSHTYSPASGGSPLTTGFNPDAAFNPDAPSGGGGGHNHGSHSHGGHSGIHRHGEDHFASRLIFEWQACENTRAVANFIVVSGGWSDISYGYSLGLRHDFSHQWAVGLEAIGDLDSNGEHEIVGGVWYNPRHDMNVRLGFGSGIGQDSPELSVYSGLTWRF